MPTPVRLKAPFFYQSHYHIVFKSIDGLLLFNKSSDYTLFLQRFSNFLLPFIDIWAFILLQNHVHLIIHVKTEKNIREYLAELPVPLQTKAMKKLMTSDKNSILIDELIERQFNSFMVSYVNSINNQTGKQGGFFQKPFKRILIADESHLQQAIIYVHANAQKHGLTKDFRSSLHSSYNSIIEQSSSFIDTSAVLTFFKGKEAFVEQHRMQVEQFYSNNWPSSKIEV